MLVQVHTDNHVQGAEKLTTYVQSQIEESLARFGAQVIRVEVFLGDEHSGEKKGDDKRCTIEARLAGLDPVASRHHAPRLEQALDGAVEKLERTLEHLLGKLAHRKGRTSAGEAAT